MTRANSTRQLFLQFAQPVVSDGTTLQRLAARFMKRAYPKGCKGFVYWISGATLMALERDIEAAQFGKGPMVGVIVDERAGWVVRGIPVLAV